MFFEVFWGFSRLFWEIVEIVLTNRISTWIDNGHKGILEILTIKFARPSPVGMSISDDDGCSRWYGESKVAAGMKTELEDSKGELVIGSAEIDEFSSTSTVCVLSSALNRLAVRGSNSSLALSKVGGESCCADGRMLEPSGDLWVESKNAASEDATPDV